MSEEKTKTPQQTEKESAAKQAKDDSKTPVQKHERYLADLERLHNEP